MIRLMLAAVLGVSTTVAYGQQGAPNPQKREACRQLALSRGFTFDRGTNKGAVKVKDFVRGCMQGTQR